MERGQNGTKIKRDGRERMGKKVWGKARTTVRGHRGGKEGNGRALKQNKCRMPPRPRAEGARWPGAYRDTKSTDIRFSNGI